MQRHFNITKSLLKYFFAGSQMDVLNNLYSFNIRWTYPIISLPKCNHSSLFIAIKTGKLNISILIYILWFPFKYHLICYIPISIYPTVTCTWKHKKLLLNWPMKVLRPSANHLDVSRTCTNCISSMLPILTRCAPSSWHMRWASVHLTPVCVWRNA